MSLGGQPCVLVFGGAPAGRRGLSNALYSVGLALLSVGEGTWERHRPTGAAPAPRQGHSLTVVAGGKRLVLFGGVAENGELFGDIHVRGGVRLVKKTGRERLLNLGMVIALLLLYRIFTRALSSVVILV